MCLLSTQRAQPLTCFNFYQQQPPGFLRLLWLLRLPQLRPPAASSQSWRRRRGLWRKKKHANRASPAHAPCTLCLFYVWRCGRLLVLSNTEQQMWKIQTQTLFLVPTHPFIWVFPASHELAMAVNFGKIVVGIYVEIKRSDGEFIFGSLVTVR